MSWGDKGESEAHPVSGSSVIELVKFSSINWMKGIETSEDIFNFKMFLTQDSWLVLYFMQGMDVEMSLCVLISNTFLNVANCRDYPYSCNSIVPDVVVVIIIKQ